MNTKFRSLSPSNVEHIVVHHSATRPDQDTTAADINLWHRRNGWTAIGYHWVIRRDGCIEPGRFVDEQGAHVKGLNDRTIGICMVGGLDADGEVENNFTDAQYRSLDALIRALQFSYAHADVVRHKDVALSPTACSLVDLSKYQRS